MKISTNKITTAGILVYKKNKGFFEFLLAHHGGPIWEKQDEGAWTIPKGIVEEGEDIFLAALRELHEETGVELDSSHKYRFLGSVESKTRTLSVWAVEVAVDVDKVFSSNTCTIEWPKGSGEQLVIPEVDRIQYFKAMIAKKKLIHYQYELLKRCMNEGLAF